MIAVTQQSQVKKKAPAKKKPAEIPEYLIYEWLDGIPVYYRGYKKVLSGDQKFEEIMAYGNLQWLLLTILKDYLQPFLGKNFILMSGEGGLHVKYKSNPSLDFAIVSRKGVSLKNAQNKYLTNPPEVVIEVDTKADFESLPLSVGGYYLSKTQALLDFGVKEVIWVYTEPQKVVVARPNQPWETVNWADEIEILGHRFSIQKAIDLFEAANEQA